MTTKELTDFLFQRKFISSKVLEISPLSGGVSGDVTLVRTADQQFVVKQALEKLRVRDEWRCDPRRNDTERQAIEFVARWIPEAVPRILGHAPDVHLFLMEYFGQEFVPWKSQLLDGVLCERSAENAGELLARIHNATWKNQEAEQLFNKARDFYALRIEPYLITTGLRHPTLRQVFQQEADRLQNARIALVHGDYSAKNLLVSDRRMVIIDWEVTCFGDPAFDSAFLLNLLYLKSLHQRRDLDRVLSLIRAFRVRYARSLDHYDAALEVRICRLTLMLMLARIDGKSPAEYITAEEHQQLVRSFVTMQLCEHVEDFESMDRRWRKKVGEL